MVTMEEGQKTITRKATRIEFEAEADHHVKWKTRMMREMQGKSSIWAHDWTRAIFSYCTPVSRCGFPYKAATSWKQKAQFYPERWCRWCKNVSVFDASRSWVYFKNSDFKGQGRNWRIMRTPTEAERPQWVDPWPHTHEILMYLYCRAWSNRTFDAFNSVGIGKADLHDNWSLLTSKECARCLTP